MRNELWVILFEAWMKEKHPYFFIITGVIKLLLILVLLLGVACVWFLPLVWWKIVLCAIVALALHRFLVRVVLDIYVDDFKSSKTVKND